MTLKQSYLLNLYCDGKINLPSFILLKKLKEKYSDLVRSDEELNSLFETAIECSKIFYSQTLKIIGKENIKFENYKTSDTIKIICMVLIIIIIPLQIFLQRFLTEVEKEMIINV